MAAYPQQLFKNIRKYIKQVINSISTKYKKMANTYSWTINALDTYPSVDSLSDVVYNIHWGLTATSDQTDSDGNPYTASAIGTQTIGEADSSSFTAFEDITQSTVESWLEASDLEIAGIKAGLDSQITEKITPTSVTKATPW
jgi:hypothetical protein